MDKNKKTLRLHPQDTVVVALQELSRGETQHGVVLQEDICAGHKFAVESMQEGADVVKYGYPIATASRNITQGQWVHTHNIETTLEGKVSYSYQPTKDLYIAPQQASFMGYKRENGRYGVRNEIWIVNLVGCINRSAVAIAQEGMRRFGDQGIDGIYTFEHPYGCSQMGEDLANTRKILLAMARHPNAGGVLVLGLGCEYITMQSMKEALCDVDPLRIKFLVAQEVEDEVQEGVDLLGQLVAVASHDQRQKVDAKHLVVGLKCGGSDGLSGITANPLLGRFSDRLISCGGSTLLTEVSEMFGAETILMNRCDSRATFEKVVSMIDLTKDEMIKQGQAIYENPSPGNLQGGISTLEDKSLGCIQKGGTRQVVDVLAYGEMATQVGLSLVTSPSNDPVAVTALVAAGAQIVLFTTGRGSPYGGPIPTIKIASNTDLAMKKPKWIDFDAGRLLSGTSMDMLADEFFELTLAVASGMLCKNELYAHREIAIYKKGITL